MTKDQDRVYKESGILFSLPETSGSASSHAGLPFRLCKVAIIKGSVINLQCLYPINLQRLYSLALGILALSAERSSWLTLNSLNCGQHSAPVYISRPKQNVCEHGSIRGMFLLVLGLMVKGRAPQPVYQQSLRGEGKTQWVISLFGRTTLRKRILGVMGTFLGIRHSVPHATIPA